MPFPMIQEIVDLIVEELHASYIEEKASFCLLATVARTFLPPVRRALYQNLVVEGIDRFMIVVGIFSGAPGLARLVRKAELRSNCSMQVVFEPADGPWSHPDQRDLPSFNVSPRSLAMFLAVCPNLEDLEIVCGDFFCAVVHPSVCAAASRRIKSLSLLACEYLPQDHSPARICPEAALHSLVTWTSLRTVVFEKLPIDFFTACPNTADWTSIHLWTETLPNDRLFAVLDVARTLTELSLSMPTAEVQLAAVLQRYGTNLRSLSLYLPHSEGRLTWDWPSGILEHVPALRSLELTGVFVTEDAMLYELPITLVRIKLDESTVSARGLIDFLGRQPVSSSLSGSDRRRPRLERLTIIGLLQSSPSSPGSAPPEHWQATASGPRRYSSLFGAWSPPSRFVTDEQVAQIAELCAENGIIWDYKPEGY